MTERATGPARQVTERDGRILGFIAEHRIVLVAHVQALLEVSDTVAYRRLRALATGGLLSHEQVLHRQPGWYQITRTGLGMIGSDLPPPRRDLSCYRHDIGVAWVWLASSRGAFGDVERMVSEREMRSRDGARLAAGGGGTPFGVPLGGVGPRGRPRLHYPDLLLVGPGGERVAVELELSAKGGRRLETIIAGYGAEPGIAAVLYLTDKPGIAREVRSAAARLGISDLVRVRAVAWPAAAGAPQAREREQERARGGARRGDERGALAR
ncbi:MAG TPA: hypothetical protein VG295_12910 [Solirubrobacteraceae bacterium]|nr:hypothetical protein [Solirubrobacteraceae bacterium]